MSTDAETDIDALPPLPELSLLDRVRVQAEILVPLVHGLEDALGKEEAHRLVAESLREHYQAQVRATWDGCGRDVERFFWDWAAASGSAEALETDYLRIDEQHLDFDVTDCQYARFWRALGEPDLGFLFQCASDFAVGEVVEPIHLRRTRTRMQGAETCDFRFTIDPSASEQP
jgi:predicted hydrocarbon binding protein